MLRHKLTLDERSRAMRNAGIWSQIQGESMLYKMLLLACYFYQTGSISESPRRGRKNQ